MRLKATLFVSLLTLSLTAHSAGTGQWTAWRVPTRGVIIGGTCSLEDDRHGWTNIGDDRREERTALVAVRGNSVRVLDGECTPANVSYVEKSPEESIAFLASLKGSRQALTAIAIHESTAVVPTLERLAARGNDEETREQAVFWLGQRGGERGFRYLRDVVRGDESHELRKKAVFAISQSDAAGVVEELVDLARHGQRDIRREAIFWLGQRAGEKAAGELRRMVDEDPDDDIRERAVFAISQLPKDRAVPLLIDLVKNHKSPNVRKKAMFWLAQTDDERAIELMEAILTKP